jgi:hypothetical protein
MSAAKETVSRYLDAYDRQERDAVLATLTEDVE